MGDETQRHKHSGAQTQGHNSHQAHLDAEQREALPPNGQRN